jgi:hypothetical protein
MFHQGISATMESSLQPIANHKRPNGCQTSTARRFEMKNQTILLCAAALLTFAAGCARSYDDYPPQYPNGYYADPNVVAQPGYPGAYPPPVQARPPVIITPATTEASFYGFDRIQSESPKEYAPPGTANLGTTVTFPPSAVTIIGTTTVDEQARKDAAEARKRADDALRLHKLKAQRGTK